MHPVHLEGFRPTRTVLTENPSVAHTVVRTYDPLNRRVKSEFADGAIATFTYDAGSRLTQADDTADSPTAPLP